MDNQIKSRFPVGMIIILVIIGWGAFSLLLSMFKMPLFQIGPFLFNGMGARISDLIIVVIMGIIFYGILKKIKWARKFAIGWYVFSMMLSWINLISLIVNRNIYDSYYQKFFSPEISALMSPSFILTGFVFSTVISSFIGVIIIIYFIKRKDFFVN